MATTQDVGLLTRKLGAADYDPARYVSEISQRCVGGEEILAQRKVIQNLSDDTNNQLKKNVYQNYSQFIETAKEISHLENDMYRLSHMITEQRKMLTGLLETSLLGDTVPLTHAIEKGEVVAEKEEEPTNVNIVDQGRKDLLDLMENVEGGREIIDVQTRFILHHGDLVEMDTGDNSALHRVHAYLCNDSLIIATWLSEKRGPVRFKMSSIYPISTIAMVNVRDLAGVKHAWKLLVTPDPRLFQCKDAESKKSWLLAYDEAKDLQRTGGIPKPKAFERTKSIRPRPNEPLNPFGDDDFEDEAEDSVKEPDIPEWLVELPDTLDVHIAQREFEQAVELLKEADEEFEASTETQQIKETKTAAAGRKETLISVLKGELRVTPDKSLQGGPRTARRAVNLLTSLGRSNEARDLLLAHRTALLRHTVKNVRPEGSTVMYVQRLGTAFFQQVCEACREFDKCFPGQRDISSALLMWTEEEIEWFADRLDKQVFNSQSPITVVSSCVSFLRKQSERLVSTGMDVIFMLDNRLQASIEKVIMEARDKAVEAVKLRWAEENWLPHNCGSRAGLEKVVSDLNSVGVANISSYVGENSHVLLTTNTVSFSLAYLQLTDQLLLLFSPGSRHLVNESLVSVLHAHLRHLEQAVRGEGDQDSQFVVKNAAFLLDTVLTLAEHRYQEKTQSDCPKLAKLHSNYTWIKEGKANLTKYTDPNYV